MNKNRLITVLVIVLILLVLVAGGILGFGWYRNNHIFVEGEAYPKDAEYLNLRGTGISVAHYEQLREAFPNCEIQWELPFQGKLYADDTRSLAISGITEEELALLKHLPQLEVIDANGCENFAQIAMVQKAYPNVRMLYHVTVDGKQYDQDTTEVTLTKLTDAEVEQLAHLPKLAAVHAEGCTDYAQLMLLREQKPDCTLTYSVSILGQDYSESTESLFWSDVKDVQEITEKLAYLPKVTSVHLEEPGADAQSLQTLLETYPNVAITWDKTVNGVTFSNTDEVIDLSDGGWDTLEQVEATMAYFPNAQKVQLGRKTDEENEAIAQFREKMRSQYKVVWEVKVCGAWMPTDDTYFMPVKYNMKVKNNQLYNLVYCEDLLCVDLGHKIVTDLSWLSGMPHLKYLIVAHNTLRDLEPIGQLKELIYLEVWDTWATDYTALYGCTALEDLNVSRPYLNVDLKQFGEMPWLKNLWLNQNGATKEERAYLEEKLPDTNINFDGYSPTAGGWRELQNYYDMRDLLEMPYNPW